MSGLTKRESRVLRMIRRGAEASRDRDRPHLIVLQHPDIKTFRTAEYMVRRLQHRGLVVRGDNMLTLELTQEGIASLAGSRHEGKSTLPAGLLPLARTKAMAKLLELRREGFADPVDALLAIAYETDQGGEWAHPIETHPVPDGRGAVLPAEAAGDHRQDTRGRGQEPRRMVGRLEGGDRWR